MAFEPDRITKKHILEAVDYIENENIDLISPTKYYVVINGSTYPPKEVMRYAHQQLNGEKIWEKSGGEMTHKYLESFGFEIVNKHEDMSTSVTENIEHLLEQYSQYIETDDYDELYKWKALKNFKENWDIEAEVFSEMLDNSLKPDDCNLWISKMYYPKNMLIEMAEEYPEAVREMFKNLFNEELNLEERLLSFKVESDRLLEAMGKGDKSHYQDFRVLTVYLTFRYPEKYYLYKYNMYKDFCKMTGLTPKPTRGADYNVSNYIEACEKVKLVIEDHPEIIEKHKSIRGSATYADQENHLLTQDLIFCSVNKDSISLEENKVEEPKEIVEDRGSDYEPNLNQILYGPPGTGKTYNAKNHAIAIIKNDPSYLTDKNKDRPEINRLFGEYKEANQIRYVTFHPSFTYEDFIEGIKPKLAKEGEDQNGELEYEIKEGIFKEICDSAKAAQNVESYRIPEKITKTDQVHKISLGNSTNPEDDKIYQYCIENGLISIGYLWDVDCSEADSKEEIKELAKEKGYSEKEFGIEALHRFKHWLKDGDVVFVSEGNKKLRAIGLVKDKNGEGYFYDTERSEYNHYRHVEWIITDQKIPVKDIYYANFSQQTIYSMYNAKVKWDYFKKDNAEPEEKRFVLIIDEINRGNIPSIFGELITLVEPDKRQGGKEQLSVELPYSKVSFDIPSNVYLIGTMNTADRSVEALDVALRRRFEFIAFYPDAGKIEQPEDFEVDLRALLTKINQRIEYLLDRDHTIGHSYFIHLHKADDPEKELKLIFKHKIIPLLEEYFYGQLHNVGLILGDDFIETKFKEGHSNSLFPSNFTPQEAPAERVVYRVKDPTTLTSLQPFISIYDQS